VTRRPARRLFINRPLLIALLIPVAAGVLAHSDSHAATAKGVGAAPIHGYIAYECHDSLCLAHPDGSSQRRLLSGFPPWPQWDPAFAPGGRRIAFRGYYASGDGAYALYVAGANGCSVHRLTRKIAGNPSWSPDGKWIAFDRSGFGEIWKVHPDGSGLTRVTSGAGAASPAWAPDGKTIAFTRVANGQGQFWLMRADGSGARRQHADVFAADQEPPLAWSHDGRRVAFVAMPSRKRAEIKLMNRDGSNVRILTKRFAFAWNPVWLPHDSGLVFLAHRAAGFGPATLFVARPDGSQAHAVATRLRTEQFAWINSSLPARSRK
jgi:Tol biopolymer transport system component